MATANKKKDADAQDPNLPMQFINQHQSHFSTYAPPKKNRHQTTQSTPTSTTNTAGIKMKKEPTKKAKTAKITSQKNNKS